MRPRLLLGAFFASAGLLHLFAVSANGQFILSNGTGDGSLTVGVDGFGSFGSSVGGETSNAIYDPIGSIGAAGTTFESGLFLSGPPTWLTSGSIGGSASLLNPEITGDSTSANSSFTQGALSFALEQEVVDSFDDSGNRVGTVLNQQYQITNAVDVPNSFTLTRYLDGDLLFDGSISDGGGVIERAGNFIAFETDTATGSAAASTFVGITSSVGLTSGGADSRFEVAPFSGLRTQISQGDILGNTVAQDLDFDGFIDTAFDVTLAVSNFISLAANETVTYTTQTLFGNAVPPAPGSSEALPLLPESNERPFVFNIEVEDPEERIWFDPEVTFGYLYEVDGVNVTSLTLPSESTIAQIGQYQLELFNGVDFDLAALLDPGETFDFAGLGVDRFRITNIDTGLLLDPDDPAAFPVGLTFANAGQVQLTITPLASAIPEPGSAILIASLGLMAGIRRRRNA